MYASKVVTVNGWKVVAPAVVLAATFKVVELGSIFGCCGGLIQITSG